ncbi:MAG: hypothetical protein CVV32_10105 [Methanomicrobiales archaeon HGW-Methanomicrobiales-3]|nr:MAG: hypothetical protein CVV32_10105 [Methanomicrobiales archaeon HGW-Methanomicrobiales-3]
MKSSFWKIVTTLLASPVPKGGRGRIRCLRITTTGHTDKNCFRKAEIEAAAGRPNGSGGKHLNGGMGASAPIITSMVFFMKFPGNYRFESPAWKL